MALELTRQEARAISQRILAQIHLADRYDDRMYPESRHLEFQRVFPGLAAPKPLLKEAFLWMWSRSQCNEDSGDRMAFIREIQQAWGDFCDSSATALPVETYTWWAVRLNRATIPFVTIAFLTHLIHHTKGIPIIDQHSFRAMNSLIAGVRPTHVQTSVLPAGWSDLVDLKHFEEWVVTCLPEVKAGTLDRFLMMFGKRETSRLAA